MVQVNSSIQEAEQVDGPLRSSLTSTKTKTVADKMAQQVKALVVKPDHLILIPKAHKMEGEKQPLANLSSDLQIWPPFLPPYNRQTRKPVGAGDEAVR